MNKIPVAVGLSLCEHVIIEHKTGNITLVNCFTQRYAAKFPSGKIPFVVFAHLTDGLGDVTLKVVIQRLDTLEEIYERSFKGQLTHPLGTFRFQHRVRDCQFPIAGGYQVTLLANGEFVAHRTIRLITKGE